MAQLFGSPIMASLLNIFFLTDRSKKRPGRRYGCCSEEIETAAVIGAGIMGAGIAAATIKRGIPVTLTDANQGALAKGVQGILNEVSFNKKTRSADVERAVEYAPMLNATGSDAELTEVDLVIEAVVENADVKRQIFARLEPRLKDDAILASNTSTIPITQLAEGLARPISSAVSTSSIQFAR